MLIRNRIFRISMLPFFLILLVSHFFSFAQAKAGSTAGTEKTVRILVITGPGEYEEEMAKLLRNLFGFHVDITDTKEYAPVLDEHIYDGFVILGARYYSPPQESFLVDIRRTKKPVLWLNYHAWLLGDEFFKKKGFEVKDIHDDQYTSLITRFAYKRKPGDTTKIHAKGDKVLYWLFKPGHELVPAAVRSGNFTYLGYSPTLDQSRPDFKPFLSVLKGSFSMLVPVERKTWAGYEQRLQEIRKDPFRTGVHMPVYVSSTKEGKDGYESDFWHSNLIRIKNAGAEWVNIVTIYYQEHVDSSEIYQDPDRTPTLDTLKAIIQDAHKLGLFVRISFVVNIAKPKKNEWRGFIHPKDRKKWWNSYKAIALKVAKLARENEVEAFIIGAELNRMQRYTDGWKDLIGKIREKVKFKGLIGYQVNFDALRLDWADMLDFVGIAAYWPLAGDRDPKMTELKLSWKKIKPKLIKWKKQHPGITLEFGEIGYVSQPYSSVLPYSWSPFRGKVQSTTEQLRCYYALHDFLNDYKGISGIHIFASTDRDEIAGDIGYSPFGKPAEKVLKKIFKLR